MSHKYKLRRIWKGTGIVGKFNALLSKLCVSKLEKDEFTILSSNCIGGCIYHRLGKRFLSPTINLFFSQTDFVEFVLNLQWYLDQDLDFIETSKKYPVAILKGNENGIPSIAVNFNHDKKEEEAREKWERRKKRIVKENIYIMLYNLDGITVEQIKRLETVNCKNKVIFTSKPLPEISWSFYIKPIMTHLYPYHYLQKDICKIRYYEKQFDFVSFLNDIPVDELHRNLINSLFKVFHC